MREFKRDQAEKFLSALFPEIPNGGNILIWTLKGRASYWAGGVPRALDVVSSLGAQDVYVGCGLAPKAAPQVFGRGKRCPADQVTHITALWADVDWADGVHKKGNLPPNKFAARDLLVAMPIQPSVIVDSGHGLQGWWFLNEPWDLAFESERRKAQDLTARWERLLQLKAQEKGWAVDSVGDHARILRIPGTWNCKAEPVPVTIHVWSENRFNPSDFEDFVANVGAGPVQGDGSQASFKFRATQGALVVNPTANPPVEKFMTLMDNLDTFKATWEKRRKDLKDQSGSGYEMALTSLATRAGWTDQEVVDLLVAWRRKHGEAPRDREDYYQRTLHKARQSMEKEAALDTMDELVNAPDPDLPPDERRRLALDSVSTWFGFKVHKIVRMVADEPIYKIHTELGEITLGRIGAVMVQSTFRQRIAAATGRIIPTQRKNWDTTCQALLDACVDVSIGDEATEVGAALAWIRGYLEDNPVGENVEAAVGGKLPFIRDGQLHIFLSPLRSWIRTSPAAGEIVSSKVLGQYMRAAGGDYKVISWNQTTRAVWVFEEQVTEKLVPARPEPA